MLKEKKIDILFYTRCAAVTENNSTGFMEGLVTANKQGLGILGAKVFLDCSDSLEIFNRTESAKINPPQNSDAILNIYAALDDNTNTDSTAGDGIIIGKTLWENERIIECLNKSRMDLRNIVRQVRAECGKTFADAVFSHASFTKIPLARASLKNTSKYPNLFASINTKAFSFGDHDSLTAVRMAEGEKLAAESAKIIPYVRLSKSAPGIAASVSSGNGTVCGVLVAGGGTAGALAAIASGRAGVDTLIAEAADCLGGIGTGGALNGYYYGLKGGLQDELDERVYQYSLDLYGRHGVRENRQFHPFAKMNTLEEMCIEANVKIEFNTLVCGVETSIINNGNLPAKLNSKEHTLTSLDAIETCSEKGNGRIRPAVTIDSTGDGDASALAGAQYTLGREPDSIQHIFSIPAIHLSRREDKNEQGETTRKYLTLAPYNVDAGYCDACDTKDISRARSDAITAFARTQYTNEARVLFFSTVVGVRASRQISGDIKITLADQIKASEFNDVIGYAASHYDNHACDYENESENAMLWTWAFDAHCEPTGCEIPYRAMLPKNIEKLIVACRALSLDFDASQQFRMQRDMQRIGEAAGYAAALAVKNNTTPRNIEIKQLQKMLEKTGALLSPETGYHSDLWKPPTGLYAGRRLFELDDTTYSPAKNLIGSAEGEYTNLMHDLDDTSSEKKRYGAALKLAAGAKNEKALTLLKQCIAIRCNEYFDDRHLPRSVPFWKAAIGVAGATGFKDAKNEIEAVLLDPKSDAQAIILAIRALAKTGDAQSCGIIEKALAENRAEYIQTFPNWGGDTGDFKDDARWKLDIAAYKTLLKLGKERKDLIMKYLDDERGYVRRAAEQCLEINN